MLSKFSSWEFFMVIGLLLFIYYIYFMLKYYGTEIRELTLGSDTKKMTGDVHPGSGDPDSLYVDADPTGDRMMRPFEETPDSTFDRIELLISDLQLEIAHCADDQLPGEEFKERLLLVLSRYPDIRDSSFKPALNEVIVTDCEKYGYNPLSHEEINKIW